MTSLQCFSRGVSNVVRSNQSDSVLFRRGDHDHPRISIPCHFKCNCHLSYFEPLCWSIQIFPCCVFLRSLQLSQDVLVLLFSSHDQRRLFGIYIFYLQMILCQRLYNEMIMRNLEGYQGIKVGEHNVNNLR